MKNEDNPTVHNFPESDASRQKVAASQDLPQSGRQQYGAKELTALHSFSQAVSASLSPDVIIKRALDEIVGQVAPDVTLVFMRDGEQLVLKGLASSDPTYQPKIDVHRVGECLCGLAVSEGEPIYSDDIYRDPRCTWEECRAAKLKSFAALPLKTRDGIIGVLGLASATGGDFSKQSYFLETLAYQLAVCLGNAVMHERLQQQAEQLQNMVDELKHANETTGRTAATLNSTLRAAPVGIGLVDSERKLGWINDALAKMMGCSQEELSGQRARILYPDDEEFERVARIKHPQVREKGFGSLETRFKRKDGQVIDVLLSSVAIDPTDQNSALVFTALDISERKRKDALLQERKHFLRRILNTEPGTVYIYDLVERRNVYINRPWLPEFGYTPEEKAALGEDIHGRLFHPDDRALIEAHHQAWRRAGEGQTREIEYRIRTKDGQWRWLRSRETAFARDDAGLVSQILGVALDITKQKLAEEELRRSEDRYRDLYETAPIAYFSMSAVDGSILRCNPAVLKILGYDKDTLMKMRVLDLYADTSEGIAKAKEVFSRFRKGESIRDVSLEMKHKDGQSVWISLSVNPVTNGEGEVIESRSAIIDITERKRAEEALKENDRWLRTILDSIQAAVVVHGPDTRIVLVNPKAQEFLGQTEKLLVGKDARDPEWSFMREDGRPLAIDEYPVNLVLAKSQPLRGFVGGIARPDEQGTKWVTLNADPVLDDQGNISQVIVTFMDITDRKKAEDELRVEKERFQVLNDESPLGISLIGPDGRYEYVNPRFVRMFGYDLDDIPEGREWFRRAYPDSDYRRQVVSAWLEDRERAVVGEARPRTFTVTCKDGSEKETHFRPVSLEDGSQLVIYEDITERIKAERELRELEEQLRQSQKMEAIGTLAGGVAHDFNNLMTAVTGFSEFALESLDPNHPAYRDIEEVKKAGERATSLTRQLLAFSRKQILEPKVVDLNEMVINMEKMLGRLIGEDIQMLTVLDQDLGQVKVDPGQLEQIVMNLAVNARDAMPQGGKLTIETANVILDESHTSLHLEMDIIPGPYVILAVSDNGPGMDEEVRAKIFDPFFTTKNRAESTGLGLSTVYGIVKQSGGDIHVYSELGHGTTFKIYFPQVEETGVAAESIRPRLASTGRREVVLVVEDEKSVRSFLSRALDALGYQVLTAANAEEAIRVSNQHKGDIHLLFTDVVMPNMSGTDLAKDLTQSRPEMKVLFMSGYTDNVMAHHGVLDPGFDFISKPFSIDELARKVREVLKLKE